MKEAWDRSVNRKQTSLHIKMRDAVKQIVARYGFDAAVVDTDDPGDSYLAINLNALSERQLDALFIILCEGGLH